MHNHPNFTIFLQLLHICNNHKLQYKRTIFNVQCPYLLYNILTQQHIQQQNTQKHKKITNSKMQEQLSSRYFTQIPQLQEIEQQFAIGQIGQQINKRDLELEFELLKSLTETKKHRMLLRSNSVLESKKNRYPQQSIYEHSRVILGVSKEGKNSDNDYVNANKFIYEVMKEGQGSEDGKKQAIQIIISQAPLDSTVRDFTKVIAENQIGCVVMLCNYVENGKTKCFQYLDDQNWHENEVKILDAEQSTQLRTITLSQSQESTHQISHIFFKSWPDKTVPENPESLFASLQQAIKYDKFLIHCSAGLGRSGVFAALICLIRSLNTQNSSISIFHTVRKLRQHRFGAVQNNQQYRFIYEYMQAYYNNFLIKQQ